jgi:hypothetical protein
VVPPDNERRPGNWNQDIHNWNTPLIEAGVYRGECGDGGAGLDNRVPSVYSVLNFKKGRSGWNSSTVKLLMV